MTATTVEYRASSVHYFIIIVAVVTMYFVFSVAWPRKYTR